MFLSVNSDLATTRHCEEASAFLATKQSSVCGGAVIYDNAVTNILKGQARNTKLLTNTGLHQSFAPRNDGFLN